MLGVPILACGGYASQSYTDQITQDVEYDGRPAVLLYAGNYDPTGEDIDRDLIARTDCWAKVLRVALSPEQVAAYDLSPNPGKATDTRAAGFIARHGELVQVEVDALDPNVLGSLFQRAIDQFWDTSAYADVVQREDQEREQLVAWKGCCAMRDRTRRDSLRATHPDVPEAQAQPSASGHAASDARLTLKYDTTPPTTDDVADVIDTWRDHGWTD